MKRVLILSILFLIALLAFLINFSSQNLQNAKTTVPIQFYPSHIQGGFGIDTPGEAINAAKDGIQVAFLYGLPPTPSNILRQKLQSLQMKVIDANISSYLHYYECHRTKVLRPDLMGPGQYCDDGHYPDLTDENALLAVVADHLKQVKTNQLIIGYWVLDDWVQWDAGSARELLIKIHSLIQQYTPGLPAICGFGGGVELNKGDGWDDWIAENFSPQGCDRVGFYIYAPKLSNTTPSPSPDDYDWSMSTVLPAMFASLKQRGWNIKKEPLIGIGQAFGGPILDTNDYWVTPTAKDIETQSKSFCEHGAAGLVFYAWNDSGYGPTTQTPMNNTEIQTGIQRGISACKQYWSEHS